MKKIYTMNRGKRNSSIFGNVCVNNYHLLSKVKHTFLLMLLSIFLVGTINAQYVSKSNLTGNYESQASWTAAKSGTIYPATNGNANQAMTISTGAIITRTGDLNPVTVTVNGTFIVNGNYTNSQWGGLTVSSGGKVEIFGNLTGTAGVDVNKGGILIVHGDFVSTGSSVAIKGDMIVRGSYSTSSGTNVNVNGNLVVGGNFTHSGGGMVGVKDDNLYITNPNAIITNPGWGSIKAGDYGTLDDFIKNEASNPVLVTIVEQIGIISSSFNWLGTQDANWFNAQNWNKKAVPSSSSEVVIDATANNPVISGNTVAQTGTLNIKAGSSLIVNAGGKLTVNGNLVITDAGGLVLNNQTGDNGMASLITKGTITGTANIKLTVPKEKWFYVSSALNGATLGNFSTGATGAKVHVFRNNQWFSTGANNTNTATLKLEGVLVKYEPTSGTHFTLNYTGTLNNGIIERTYATAGWYLFGNPYPSFINWQDNTQWTRPNIEETIWFRSQIGDAMTFITYNRLAPEGARSALTVGSGTTNETELALIPPMQSVWIKVKAATTIAINNNIRTHGVAGSKLKSAQVNSNSEADVIRITSDNGLSKDGAVVYFDRNATDEPDNMDSEKRFNDSELVPEIYSRVGSTAMAINGLTHLDTTNRSIPLSVRNKNAAAVTLTFNLNYFKSGHKVELEDLLTGNRINLRDSANYSYTPTGTSDVHDRFMIHLTFVPEVVVAPEEEVVIEVETPTTDESTEENVGDSTTHSNTDDVDANSDSIDVNTDVKTDVAIIDTTSVNTDENSDNDANTDVAIIDTTSVTTDENSDNDANTDVAIIDTTSVNTDENSDRDNTSTTDTETDDTEINKVSTSVVNAGEANNNGITITGMRGRAVVAIKSDLLDYGDGRIEIFSKDGRLVSETYTGASTTLVTLPSSGGDAFFIIKVTAGEQTKSTKVLGSQ